jgi:uncharacterized membrane protein
MNITGNILLFACMYMVLPLLYFMMRNLSKPKKNIILGVTLPHEAREHEDVLAVCIAYRSHLAITCLILTALSLPSFLFEHSSTTMTYLLTWLLAAIIGPVISYTLYHRKLKSLKRENNWFSPVEGKLMLDTNVSYKAQRQLSGWLFAPPFALSLVPLIAEYINQGSGDFALLYGINALLVAFSYLFYRILYRQKPEVIDKDTSLSIALTSVRRYNWGKFWLAFSWMTAFFALGMWLFAWHNTGMLIISGLYVAVVVFVAINAEFSTRKAQESLSAASGKEVYVDDDKNWLIGMFYHNPFDKHIIINARVGINTTINLAHPAGKVVMALALLILLGMPFLGLWMVSEELTPIRLVVSDSTFEVHHTALAYSIPLAEVQQAELLEALPQLVKTNGIGMEALLKGKFRAADIGNCEVCLNPQVAPFILIKTADKTYIFGAAEPGQTREAYSLLEGR